MKFTSFTIIILIINLAILLAIGGVLIYLVYLLIKALRKYIKSEPMRQPCKLLIYVICWVFLCSGRSIAH